MSYILNILHNSTTYNVSDYLTDLSEIPYYARNYDYSPISDDIQFKLSNSYLTEFPNTTFDIDDKVLIYSSSVLLFNGNISKQKFDPKTLQFEYQAADVLQRLKTIRLGHDQFPEASSSADDMVIYNYAKTVPMIKIDTLFTAMFNKIGLTLDYTYKTDEIITGCPYLSGSWAFTSNPLQVTWTEETKNISLSDLYLYVYQLYSVNQDFPVYWNGLYDQDTESKRITLFDLLQKINNLTGYVFIPKDATSYYVTNVRTSPSRSPNYELDADLYTEKGETGTKVSYYVPFRSVNSPVPPALPPNQAWGWYDFIPWRTNYGGHWYVTAAAGNSDPTHNMKLFESSVGNVVYQDTPTIEWYNHLIFWELPSADLPNPAWQHTCNIFMPSLKNGINGLLNRPSISIVGEAYIVNYENLINTEKVAAVENYISIDRTDGGKVTSTIKLATYTY